MIDEAITRHIELTGNTGRVRVGGETLIAQQDGHDEYTVAFDASDWPRFGDFLDYAQRHSLSLGDAAIQLINSGLSHQ